MTTTAHVKRFVTLIDGVVRPLGFSRHGQKWEHQTSETICQLTLQKSRGQYYLNFAVSLLQLGRDDSGAEPVWHIVGRMFSPDVREKVEWERCLNVSRVEVSGKPREIRFLEILEERIVPLLLALETLEGIRAALFADQLRGMGVRTELQDLTGYRA
jgi:hypothetical protein